MIFQPEYIAFLQRATKEFVARSKVSTDQDLLLKLSEEVGEVAEAYSRYAGTNPHKPATGHMVPVVQELADVVCTALVAIAHLGFNPDDLLEWQMNKVKDRYPEIWPTEDKAP